MTLKSVESWARSIEYLRNWRNVFLLRRNQGETFYLKSEIRRFIIEVTAYTVQLRERSNRIILLLLFLLQRAPTKIIHNITVDSGCLKMKQNSQCLDERVLTHAPVEKMTPLPDGFQPSNYDVICGRGKSCFNHVGNRRFRLTIEMHVPKYAEVSSKLEKSLIVMSIVDIVRENSPQGGFVKYNARTSRWHEVGDHLAREKVGQALREALHAQDPTKREAKKLKGVSKRITKAVQAPPKIQSQVLSMMPLKMPSKMPLKMPSHIADFSFLDQDSFIAQLLSDPEISPIPHDVVSPVTPWNRAA